jgi:hypothetical protein
MSRGGARVGAGRPKKPASPKAPDLPAAPRGGARPGAGRPMSKQFAPTADQRGNVEAMTGFGIPEAEICRLIKNPETGQPIDKKTFELHFADEIATGLTKANAAVAQSLFAEATKGQDPRSRIDAAKFWLSRRADWKETSVYHHKGGIEISNAREIVTSLIARLSSARTAGSGNSSDDGSAT